MPAAQRPSKSPARAAKSPARAKSPRPSPVRVKSPAKAAAAAPPGSPPLSPGKSPTAWEDKTAYSFETGERFRHPGLANQNTAKLLMKVWQPGSFISVALLLSTIWVGLPSWFFRRWSWCPNAYNPQLAAWALAHGAGSLTDNQLLIVSLFWRFNYNAVLGAILRAQSKTKFLTRFVGGLAKRPKAQPSVLRWAVSWLIEGTAGTATPLTTFPAGFNAWLLCMQLVNVILPLDSCAFTLVVMRYFDQSGSDACWPVSMLAGVHPLLAPERLAPWVCAAASATLSALGWLLIVLSIWGKKAAFTIIGHYAWFWGDFFYGLDLELKFDGIFELAPHPMYTVGYGWMYGLALVTGSSHVTALAFTSHLLQIGFLVFVENPHIYKMYGKEEIKEPPRPRTGDSDRANVLLIKNFSMFRASDWQLVIIGVLLALLYGSAGGSDYTTVIFSMAVRGALTLVQGLVLSYQSKRQTWTNHFMRQGSTLSKAFAEWTRLYNGLDFVMNISFYLTAARFAQRNYASGAYASLLKSDGEVTCLAMALFGGSLIALSGWATRAVYDALGDAGWFYADFFLPRDQPASERTPVYEGIFRYLNNPEVLLGKLYFYGFAILALSSEVGVLALFSHTSAWIVLVAVEEPHFRSFYDQGSIRVHSSAVADKLNTKLRAGGSQLKTSAKTAMPRLAASVRSKYAVARVELGRKRTWRGEIFKQLARAEW